jgi:hypothetical protein
MIGRLKALGESHWAIRFSPAAADKIVQGSQQQRPKFSACPISAPKQIVL